MVIDEAQPLFDATRVEHLVVPGEPADVYEIVLRADFMRAWRESSAVQALFALRSLAERLVSRTPPPEPEPAAMRLADMPPTGQWVLLGSDPPNEIAFGAAGRFWAGETAWEEIEAAEFAAYHEPGRATVACNISLRPYGDRRTLVSYEARMRATDAGARRGFLRYWWVVSPFVGVVMRSMLRVIERDARAAGRSID
jgi:hypothetical protein